MADGQSTPRTGADRARSYEAIDHEDLARLGDIATSDWSKALRNHPQFLDRVLCVALCQGAGLHYVGCKRGWDRLNGIKDFDVWTFFAAIPGTRFPNDRRRQAVDFGPSKFGRWPDEPPEYQHYRGRRVDLLMRALPVPPNTDPASALTDYLSGGRTRTAQLLAQKGVILIEPGARKGEIVWPPATRRAP